MALQYGKGIHKIASWSHITNAHPVPGPGIVEGLRSVGKPLGRGLLLLAEMSSKGNLATGQYTQDAITMARAYKDFVIGFIAMERIEYRHPLQPPAQGSLFKRDPEGSAISLTTSLSPDPEDWIIMTPGVGLDVKGDGLGQQYRTPHAVVYESGCDVIIVGRGIYGKGDDINEMKIQARRYREEGWRAYKARTIQK